MLTQLKSELEEILACRGETRNEGFPIFNCNIGDQSFQQLIEILKSRYEHIGEIEEEYARQNLNDINTDTYYENDEKRERDRCIHARFTNILSRLQGIEYGSWLEEDLRGTEKLLKNSFIGIPFQLADSHVHAYNFITRKLDETSDKLTIVRLDAHSDRVKNLEEQTHRANYFSQIVLDPKYFPKIKQVVCSSGELNRKVDGFKINEIPFSSIELHNLSKIDSPTIIDIDLDGIENGGHRREFNHCRIGGHIYSDSGYYNQSNVSIHPIAAARILRAQISNPISIGVALERGFRNRLFWYRIEKDFIEELSKP